MKNKLVWVFIATVMITACKETEAPLPKPRAYPRVEFPNKTYKRATLEDCSFGFEVPSYSEIVKDEYFFEDEISHDCWFDLSFTDFNGKLHCSYFPIANRTVFDSLVTDAFELVGKHRIKANYRDEFVIQKENGVSGILFDLGGPVASPLQFFLTDSTQHFLRGALYFENKVNPDSMNIIHEFIKEDVNKMIETFAWN